MGYQQLPAIVKLASSSILVKWAGQQIPAVVK
jgi:hypothetical protein